MPASARDIAVEALRDRSGNVTAHLERLLGEAELSPSDRALARELALGTLRRRRTLQAVMKAFLKDPERRLPRPIEEILLVAIHQILFLDRVPDFAAVSEAVEQAKRLHHHRQGGLVNAVLREIARHAAAPATGPPPVEACVVPTGPNRFRRFDRPVLPDPRANPAEYFGEAWSLPDALAARWVEGLGLAAAAEVAAHADARAPMILRVNRLKGDVAAALQSLAADGAEAHAHANGLSVVLAEHRNVTELAAFREGLVQPQDAAATAVVVATDPRPGMNVLDFCAAPGTKTTHMAERMDNRGRITAVDVSREKLDRIESNCRRMGIDIVEIHLAETVGGMAPESFDRVLVDAPCSNTGVLSRRAEARWRFTAEGLGKLAADQQFLLAAGARFVAPGGRLVYSTCSIEPEENQRVAERLLGVDRRFRLVRQELTLPGGAEDPTQWHDGGYVAIFEASGAA